jgi:hypothetical protein
MSRNAGSGTEPWMTSKTCTDPDCTGSCGRISHPVLVPADEETIGCG